MNNLFKISILLLALLLIGSGLFGQNTQDALPLIPAIELAENHYQELQPLDKSKREEFSWMDATYYPSELYLDNAILFAMAKPISNLTSIIANTHYKFNKEGDPTTIQSQVSQLLNGIDVKMLDGKNEILVDFMLNGKSEILVLSTNNKLIDSIIKTRLNYKKLTKHSLEVNKKYTLPVVFNID